MEIILTLLYLLLRLFDYLTTPIYTYRAKGVKKTLPPLKNEILRISATELARQIRNQKISSEDVCTVYIERIKEVNTIINAVAEERYRFALREAKQIDSYLKTTSLSVRELKKIKPLLGVPITIKESCSVKGMQLSVGLESRKGFKAEIDGDAVGRIRSCGGIILLVSNVPQLCLSWECNNYISGKTNNPYDSSCTSGGSSGGEGALLGAGASLIGVGSDVGGSIRLPAAFNGVFGHKPTPRTIPIKGHFPIGQDDKYNDLLVIGPIVRYATDFKLIMSAMCGSRISSELNLSEPVHLNELKVFHLECLNMDYILPPVSPEIKSAVRQSVEYLREAGATVDNYKFEELNNITTISGSVLFSIKDIPDVMKGENTLFAVELIKALLGRSKFTLQLIHFYVLEIIFKYIVGDYNIDNAKLKLFMKEKLSDNGVLLLPTFYETASKHNQSYFKNGYAYMVLPNSLGLPATSVPCGFDNNGLPIGIQVIAGPYQDRLCIAVAEELEKHFGGWVPPPER